MILKNGRENTRAFSVDDLTNFMHTTDSRYHLRLKMYPKRLNNMLFCRAADVWFL
jgi:hypothetical protein